MKLLRKQQFASLCTDGYSLNGSLIRVDFGNLRSGSVDSATRFEILGLDSTVGNIGSFFV